MEQKILVSIILIAFLTGVLAGAIGYYYSGVFFRIVFQKPVVVSPPDAVKTDAVKKAAEERVAKQQAKLDQIRKDFPEVLSGVISISDKKTAIRIDEGKEYLFWPVQPKSIYELMGIKNGDRVEVQAKFLDRNRIQWGFIKVI